jgi:hypothetical protein
MTGLIVLPVLLGVAFAVAMWLSRGLEDEWEQFGDDQYQDARVTEIVPIDGWHATERPGVYTAEIMAPGDIKRIAVMFTNPESNDK